MGEVKPRVIDGAERRRFFRILGATGVGAFVAGTFLGSRLAQGQESTEFVFSEARKTLRLPGIGSDPASPLDGEIWRRSDTGELRHRAAAGTTRALIQEILDDGSPIGIASGVDFQGAGVTVGLIGKNAVVTIPGSGTHNILSATHSDAITAAATRGDLMVGNAGGLWSDLAVGGSGTVLRSDGTDPSWAQLAHSDLGGVSADQHHAQAHNINTHDTTASGANLNELTGGGETALHTHAGGGGNHNILSGTHLDTTPGSVVRGDLMVGIAGPTWARLGLGSSGFVIRSNGTDPSWAQLAHADLGSVSADQHHAQDHVSRHHSGGLDALVLSSIAGELTDGQHGSRGSALHADSHARSHALDSASDHSGSITDAQHGTRATANAHAHGDLSGVTANQHHNQSHVLADTTGLGADHTTSGLTIGQVLRASGTTTAAFAQLAHGDLGSVTANQHHAQAHALTGADHTHSGGTAGRFLRETGASTFAFEAPPFSIASTVLSPAINDYVVWRALFACTVTAIKGYQDTGTGSTINAFRGSLASPTLFRSANLTINAADSWVDGGAVQNTAVSVGDAIYFRIAGVSGAPNELAIQLDLTRP